MATGRSDYPNQVNNVLGFPFIFRGALDVRASQINEEMKMAATRTCSTCTRKVLKLYQCIRRKRIFVRSEYIIPKPFDPECYGQLRQLQKLLWIPRLQKSNNRLGSIQVELQERSASQRKSLACGSQSSAKSKSCLPEGEEEDYSLREFCL